MQPALKRKSQSLPRLKKAQLWSTTQRLVKMFSKQPQTPLTTLNPQPNSNYIPDPEQRHKEQVQGILLRSKSMIQNNKEKIETAKKFRILKKKSAIGPFLTGVDIYKEQERSGSSQYEKMLEKQHSQPTNEQSLRQLLSQDYDDLSQLRKMIRKTSKNLGIYKKQTMSIKKNLLLMTDKFNDPIGSLTRNKLLQPVYEFTEEV